MLKYYISLQNRLSYLRNEEGQTMAEYGVVLAVITVFIITALTLLAGGIDKALTKVTAVL